MSKKHKNTKLYAATIDVEVIKDSLKDVSTKELNHVIESFKSNIDNLSNVTFLPVSIAYGAVRHTEWIERFRRASEKANKKGKREDQKAEIEALMDKFDSNDNESWSLSVLDGLIEDDEIRKGISSLFSLAIVNLWTVVETLSTDLWIAIVNGKPETFGKAAIQEYKDVISKHITNALIESSFEDSLKSRIGEISSQAYDFTGTTGIAKAFSVILKKQNKDIQSLFKNADLVKLQAMRNVLVHNGGIIDKAYCRMLQDKAGSFLGNRVELNANEFSSLANNVLKLCVQLILLADHAQ